MSIHDDDGEIVRFPGFWSVIIKVAVALSVPATMAVITLLAWVITKSFEHDRRIAILEDRSYSNQRAENSNTNIITSDAGEMAQELVKSARTYLTTAEVAKREQVSERTVTDWITAGRLVPPPTKEGKEWRISAQYRIPPQTAAISGAPGGEP